MDNLKRNLLLSEKKYTYFRNMSNITETNRVQYNNEEDFYFIFLGSIINLMGSYNYIEIIQNLKFISNKNSIILLLFLASLIFSAVCVWGPYFIFFNSLRFHEIEIYFDIRLILFCLLSSILCNISGLCMAFLPFFDRTYNDYKRFISTKIYSGNLNPSKINMNYSKFKTFTFKRRPTQNMNFSTFYQDKFTTNNQYKSNMNNDNENINKSEGIGNENDSNDFSNSNWSIENGNYKNENNLNSNNHQGNKEGNLLFNKNNLVDDYDFSNFFLKNRLSKKELIYYFIGGFIMGSSILIIHYISITAIKVNNTDVSINAPIQILICILSFSSSFFLHFAFYLKYSIWLKIILTCGFTIFISCINGLSVKFVLFTSSIKNSTDNLGNYTDYVYYDDEFDMRGFISIEDFSKLILILMVILPFLSKSILNNLLNKSNKIIKYIREFSSLGNREFNFILDFSDFLKPVEFFSEKDIKNMQNNAENMNVFNNGGKLDNVSNIIDENEDEEIENSNEKNNENNQDNDNERNNTYQRNDNYNANSNFSNNLNVNNPNNVGSGFYKTNLTDEKGNARRSSFNKVLNSSKFNTNLKQPNQN